MEYRMGVLVTSLATAVLMSTGCAMSGDQKAIGKPSDMFLANTVQGSGAEVALSRLALERSTNPEVKRFAQQDIRDHEKLNQEIIQIANRRGMTVSTEPNDTQERISTHLSKLSGNEFDREYMSEMIADHAKMTAKLEAKTKQTKDPEIQQLAARQLPLFQEHLQTAQSINEDLVASR
jgi:putative membrane protein